MKDVGLKEPAALLLCCSAFNFDVNASKIFSVISDYLVVIMRVWCMFLLICWFFLLCCVWAVLSVSVE
jgi:hypothetical protein